MAKRAEPDSSRTRMYGEIKLSEYPASHLIQTSARVVYGNDGGIQTAAQRQRFASAAIVSVSPETTRVMRS